MTAHFSNIHRQTNSASAIAIADSIPNHLYMPCGAKFARAFGPEQEGWNNKFVVEANADPFSSLYELTNNGRDATVALWQATDRFLTNPQTPTQAQNELLESGQIVRGSGHPQSTTMCFSQQHRDNGMLNVLIGDNGIGVPPPDFATTIMSIMSSNKMGNKLMSGIFGCGGKAVLRYAGCMLVTSCSLSDPDLIAWTIVKRTVRDGYDTDIYVYLVDKLGNVPTLRRSELDPNSIILLDELDTPANALDPARSMTHLLATKVVLPRASGTIIRCLDMKLTNNPVQTYNQLREIGFGNTLPIRLLMPAASKKNTYNTIGLRSVLNNPKRLLAATGFTTTIPVRAHQTPTAILGGRATLELWALDYKDGSGQEERSKTPVGNLLSNGTDAEPVFITVNDHTHARLPVAVLLKNSKFEWLKGRVVIEVNCNDMSSRERSLSFDSNREGLTKPFEAEVKDAVLQYLKSQAHEGTALWQYNEEVRRALMSGNMTLDDEQQRDRLAKLLTGSIAGTLFNFNAPVCGAAIGVARAKLAKPTPSGQTRPKLTWVSSMVPQQLRIATRTVRVGTDNFISVRTDAVDQFEPYLTIAALPDWMVPTGSRLGLVNGSDAFNVTVKKGTPIGTVGRIKVCLDITKLVPPSQRIGKLPVLTAEATIEVVDPKQRLPDDKGRTKTGSGMPEMKINWVHANDDDFVSKLEPGNLDPSRVAGRYVVGDGRVDVFLNADYPTYVEMMTEVSKRYSAEISEDIKTFFGFGACAQALQMEAVANDFEVSSLMSHLNFATTLGTLAMNIPPLLDTASQRVMETAKGRSRRTV